MVEVCSVHVRKSISHMHTFTANGIHIEMMKVLLIDNLNLKTCHGIHISWFFGPHFYTHHIRSSKFVKYLCFDTNSHNPEFHQLVTWLKCVLCI